MRRSAEVAMSVGLSLIKNDTNETVERYTVGGSYAIHDIWVPVATRAGLDILSQLGAIMGFHNSAEITAFRDEFIELKRFIVQETPPEFEERGYPPKAISDRIDHIVMMLEKAIKDDSLHVHCS
jgi:hypothetical protein